MNLNAMEGHTEFWGKPSVLYLTARNIPLTKMKFTCKFLKLKKYFKKLSRKPLIYLQPYSLYSVCPVLEKTYLHLLFMCSTAHARYIQIAGLEINYLQLITNYILQLYALLA